MSATTMAVATASETVDPLGSRSPHAAVLVSDTAMFARISGATPCEFHRAIRLGPIQGSHAKNLNMIRLGAGIPPRCRKDTLRGGKVGQPHNDDTITCCLRLSGMGRNSRKVNVTATFSR